MLKTLLTIFALIFGLCSSPVLAANHFVDPSAGSDGDGTVGSPWKYFSSITGMAEGDDLYIKCDTTTNEALTVSWSGNSGNWAVVGAYYGAGTIGVSGNKPRIWSTWTAGSGGCTYTPLVRNEGYDYVEISNLDLRNSAGRGIQVGDTSQTNHIKIHDCYISTICREAIVTQHYGNNDYLIYDNEVVDCARYRCEGGTYYNCAVTISAYPGTPTRGSNAHAYRNKIYETCGEALDLIDFDDSSAYENEIYSMMSMGIYVAGFAGANNITVRDNKITGTTNTDYHRVTNYDGYGISIAQESTAGGGNYDSIYIYGNMISYCYRGIMLTNASLNEFDQISNVDLVNNTFIDCKQNLRFNTDAEYINFYVMNNIIWCISADCVQADTVKPSGVSPSYNLWYPAPPSAWAGTGDVTAVPGLSKTSGWRAATVPTGADFTPVAGGNVPDRLASARSITALPVSGSIWPASVTTADATTLFTPGTPAIALPTAGSQNISVTPYLESDPFWTGASDETDVDFGAIQLNYAGSSHTASRWRVYVHGASTATYDTGSSANLVAHTVATPLANSVEYDVTVAHYKTAEGPESDRIAFTTESSTPGPPPAEGSFQIQGSFSFGS